MQNEGVVEGLSDLVASKSSGLIGMAKEWTTGVNGFGEEIRDPSSSAFKQLEQTLAYSLQDLEPISVRAMETSTAENKTKSNSLSFLGFGPAPKYITESKTEGQIRATFGKYYAQKQTPFEKAQWSSDAREMRKAWDAGDDTKYQELLDKAVEKFDLSPRDQARFEKGLQKEQTDPTLKMFQHFTWQQQKKLLDQMTEEEREKYLPYSNKEHLRGNYEPAEAQ
jgi:hypothetical protein